MLGNFCFAQEETLVASNVNDISGTSKIFKEHFFDALSDRSVGKYEKAIISINTCIDMQNKMPVLYYELAQNEIALRFYKSAKENLNKALAITPNSEEILESLSRVHFILQEFDKRILVLQKMSNLNSKYKYNLANAYRYTQKYGEALKILRDYQKEYSYDQRTDSLRNQLYVISKDKQPVIEDIEKSLTKNPKNENAYVQLINIYKKEKQENKVIATIKRFKEAVPKAPMLKYINFQQCIDQGDLEKASIVMKEITKSNAFNKQVKSQVLTDFNKYRKKHLNNTQKISEATALKTTAKNPSNIKLENMLKLPLLTITEGATEGLLETYQKNLESNTSNYNLIKNTLVLQLYFERWNNASTLVTTAIKKYPSQPFLYLIKGVLLTKENKEAKAINNFKEGLDYIVDNAFLERALYLNLAKAYTVIGDTEKAKKYKNKGDKIEATN